MFDFELDDSQRELQATARRLFDHAGGLSLARELLERGGGFSRQLWGTMVDLDWVGLGVPEALGGSGGGVLDLYAVCMESGRAAVSSPLIPSSVIAGHVLAGGADGSRRVAELLGRLASGAVIVAPALLEAPGVWDERGVEARLAGDGGTRTVTGAKVLVPFADVAERLVVTVRDGDGVSVVLVDPGAPGVSLTPVDNLASLPLFAVIMDRAEVDEFVGRPGEGWALVAPALARGAVLRAAETAGAGERMLEMAVAYAMERNQFGKAIGSYQAVQYLCTDVGIESHLTGLLARRAAWLIDAGQHYERAVAAAKLYASRAAAHMAHQAHEVFAGLGFMMEHDLHLLTRHAKHWEHDLGDVRHHSEDLVRALEREYGDARL
jgi:alkylation response protein AidB-like acyl-CoA dehydrogenase